KKNKSGLMRSGPSRRIKRVRSKANHRRGGGEQPEKTPNLKAANVARGQTMKKYSSKKFQPNLLALEDRKLMSADTTIDVTLTTAHRVSPPVSYVTVDGSDYDDVVTVTNYQVGRSISLHLEQWSNGVELSARDQNVNLGGLTLRSYSPFSINGKGGNDRINN